MIIRLATEADAVGMLAIYGPYVEKTAVSFEEMVPSLDEYTERVAKYCKRWCCYVAEDAGGICGYAYGSSHRERAAYRWSVETSVYISPKFHRQGLGRRLYGELMPALAVRGFCNAYAGVALPNEASVGLHQAVGFAQIGIFPRVGWKFGLWRDVAWLHLALRQSPPELK